MLKTVFIAASVILSVTGIALAANIMQQQRAFGQEAFTAELSGDQVLPPVNTDANGTISIQGNNQSLNYQLALSDISNVTGAHIHFGDEDENGKILVSLFRTESQSMTIKVMLSICKLSNR